MFTNLSLNWAELTTDQTNRHIEGRLPTFIQHLYEPKLRIQLAHAKTKEDINGARVSFYPQVADESFPKGHGLIVAFHIYDGEDEKGKKKSLLLSWSYETANRSETEQLQKLLQSEYVGIAGSSIVRMMKIIAKQPEPTILPFMRKVLSRAYDPSVYKPIPPRKPAPTAALDQNIAANNTADKEQPAKAATKRKSPGQFIRGLLGKKPNPPA